MLIQQLRDLEEHGIVTRRVYAEVPPKVEYALSSDGLALRPALVALQTWAASRSDAKHTRPNEQKAKLAAGGRKKIVGA